MTHFQIAFIALWILIYTLLPGDLQSQQLHYRQGELLLHLKPDHGWDQGQKRPFVNRSRTLSQKIQAIRKLKGPWNIWLVSFDFTKIPQNQLIEECKGMSEVLHIQLNRINQHRI